MGIHGNILCIHQYETCFLTVQKEYKRRSKQSKINIIKSCHFDLITKNAAHRFENWCTAFASTFAHYYTM